MANQSEFGAFIPTTDIFDTSTIDNMENIDPNLKDLLIRLAQATNNIRIGVNLRDAGYYVEQEFLNGQLWFEKEGLDSSSAQTPEHRQVSRKVINFGALPNAASKTSAHGLTVNDQLTFTRIYGTASDTTGHTYIPLPYSSITAANNGIELSVDGTNVIINTGAVDRTAYDTCYIVLEYIQE